MPSSDQPEYNPNIIGFTEEQGPVMISLKKAKTRYGKLPSDYQLVSVKDGRKPKKVLNLALGKLITEELKTGSVNFKKPVFQFFENWHRNWKEEFGIQMSPFFNLNNPERIHQIITECRNSLFPVSSQRLRTELDSTGLLRKDILNSIPDSNLLQSVEKILKNKQNNLSNKKKYQAIQLALARIRMHRILTKIKNTISCDLAESDQQTTTIYADEIANALFELSLDLSIPEVEKLSVPQKKGVEFEFATRDNTYLMLGKETGDCTADKTPFQADRNIENIYWTVFPWILDRNYQILKVFHDGQFVMKVHLLPLYVFHENMDKIILAIDAIETIRAFRDDIQECTQMELLENRKEIFHQVLQKIIHIGKAMGIDDIYAEKFSNTGWVREYLNDLPEIFLHVNNLIKLDELEDVFCLTQTLCKKNNLAPPTEIFMEIQMKNTSLIPSVSKKNNAVKSFAVIKGRSDDGIPMKKIIGI
jgi:hypothetical protein